MVQDPLVRLRHFLEVFALLRVRLFGAHLPQDRDGALDPVDDAEQHILLRGVELLRLVAGVDLLIGMQLFQHPVPAQIEPDLIVAAEVVHLADAGQEAVFLLHRLEVAEVKDRRHLHVVGGNGALKRAHPLQNEHPAPGKGVVHVHIDRVRLHQPPEVTPPERRAVERAVLLVVAFRIEGKALGRRHAAVIVLVHIAGAADLLSGLLFLSRAQRVKALRKCISHAIFLQK